MNAGQALFQTSHILVPNGRRLHRCAGKSHLVSFFSKANKTDLLHPRVISNCRSFSCLGGVVPGAGGLKGFSCTRNYYPMPGVSQDCDRPKSEGAEGELRGGHAHVVGSSSGSRLF